MNGVAYSISYERHDIEWLAMIMHMVVGAHEMSSTFLDSILGYAWPC